MWKLTVVPVTLRWDTSALVRLQWLRPLLSPSGEVTWEYKHSLMLSSLCPKYSLDLIRKEIVVCLISEIINKMGNNDLEFCFWFCSPIEAWLQTSKNGRQASWGSQNGTEGVAEDRRGGCLLWGFYLWFQNCFPRETSTSWLLRNESKGALGAGHPGREASTVQRWWLLLLAQLFLPWRLRELTVLVCPSVHAQATSSPRFSHILIWHPLCPYWAYEKGYCYRSLKTLIVNSIWGHPVNFGFASYVFSLSCLGVDTWMKAFAAMLCSANIVLLKRFLWCLLCISSTQIPLFWVPGCAWIDGPVWALLLGRSVHSEAPEQFQSLRPWGKLLSEIPKVICFLGTYLYFPLSGEISSLNKSLWGSDASHT